MLNNLEGKKCLIVTAQSHHVAKTTAVVQELNKHGVNTTYLTSQNGNNEYSGDLELPLLDRGIPYLFLYDFLDEKLCEEIKDSAEECINSINEAQATHKIILEDHFADHGISNAIYESAENFKLFEKAIKEIQPDFCLVLYEGNFWTKVFTYLCYKFEIPIFSFQEGMYTKAEMLRPSVSYTITKYSTNVFLWGHFSKEMLSVTAQDPSKLLVVGAPHTDELYQRMISFDPTKFRQMLKLNDDRKTILFILPSVISDLENRIKTFSRYTEELGVAGIIKFRPAGNLDEFNSLKSKYQRNNLHLFYSEEIYELILGSDLVISGNTTAGLEALVLEKPMLYLSDKVQDDLVEFKEVALDTINLEQYDKKELEVLKSSLHPDPENRRLIKQYSDRTIYKYDGKASERIAHAISQIIDMPSPIN